MRKEGIKRTSPFLNSPLVHDDRVKLAANNCVRFGPIELLYDIELLPTKGTERIFFLSPASLLFVSKDGP